MWKNYFDLFHRNLNFILKLLDRISKLNHRNSNNYRFAKPHLKILKCGFSV